MSDSDRVSVRLGDLRTLHQAFSEIVSHLSSLQKMPQLGAELEAPLAMATESKKALADLLSAEDISQCQKLIDIKLYRGAHIRRLTAPCAAL
jgi:hypothetical protein